MKTSHSFTTSMCKELLGLINLFNYHNFILSKHMEQK